LQAHRRLRRRWRRRGELRLDVGEDPAISRAALNMRGVSITGFNLGRGLAKRTPGQVRDIYADLAVKIRDGVLKAPIDSYFRSKTSNRHWSGHNRAAETARCWCCPTARCKPPLTIGGRMADANTKT